jgi:membrane-bound inhibitor of C-type lysozyme
MTKTGWAVVIVLVIIIAVGAWAFVAHAPSSPTDVATSENASSTDSGAATTGQTATSTEHTLVATAVYSCDQGKTITAAYFSGPQAPQPKPGQPPTPTGSVDVSLDGGATTTLSQTISADGARYGNAGESLVFWNKGNTALVMKNGSTDTSYSNCATK